MAKKFKKIAKMFKNLKHTIMASFKAKICWERQRKSENKNYRSITFQPNWLEKIPKKNKKIQKIQLWHHFKPK